MSDTQAYVFVDDTCDDGKIRKYPENAPYITRDQGVRPADETVKVVIGDIVDILEHAGFEAAALKAQNLYNEANALPWDGGWTDTTKDENAPEKLIDILREAEQLDGIHVEWNSDAGTVWITLADKWEEFDGEDN